MKTFLQIAALLAAAWAGAGLEAQECAVEADGATLDCSGRGLTSAPGGSWPHITALRLGANAIRELSAAALRGFPNLEELDASSNVLEELDLGALAGLPRLRAVGVEYNNIRAVAAAPAGVALSSLREVRLSSNAIEQLSPEAFLSAPSLEKLYLLGNPLVVSEASPILVHPTLWFLDLRQLRAPRLTAANLAGLPRLAALWLDHAAVEEVDGAFAASPLLRELDLRGTRVTELREGTFAPAGALRSLVLWYSALERLDVAALSGAVPAGASVDIRSTPLACACAYEGLHWWAVGRGVALDAGCGSGACSFE